MEEMYVACSTHDRDAYTILVRKPEAKRLFGRSKSQMGR